MISYSSFPLGTTLKPKNTPRFGQFRTSKPKTKIQEIEDMLDRGSIRLSLANTLEQEGDASLSWAKKLEREGAAFYKRADQYEIAARIERQKADDDYDDAQISLNKASKSRYHWAQYEQDAADSKEAARAHVKKARDYDVQVEDDKRAGRAKYKSADGYRAQVKKQHADALRIRLKGKTLISTARTMLDHEKRKKNDEVTSQDSFTPTATKHVPSTQNFDDTFSSNTDPVPGVTRRHTEPTNLPSRNSNSNLEREHETLSSKFGKMRMDEEPDSFDTQEAPKNPEIFLRSPIIEKSIDPQIIRAGYAGSQGWWQNSGQDINGRSPIIEKQSDSEKLTAGYSNFKSREQKLDPTIKATKETEKPTAKPENDQKRRDFQARIDDPKQYTHDYKDGKHTLKTTILFEAIENEYFDLAKTIIIRAPQLLSKQKEVLVRSKYYKTSIKSIFPAMIVQDLSSVKGREFADFFNQKLAEKTTEETTKEQARQTNAKKTMENLDATGNQTQSSKDAAKANIKEPVRGIQFPEDFPSVAIPTKAEECKMELMDEFLSDTSDTKITALAMRKKYQELAKKYHPSSAQGNQEERTIKFGILKENFDLIQKAIEKIEDKTDIQKIGLVQGLKDQMSAKIDAAKHSLKPVSAFQAKPNYKMWQEELETQLRKGTKRYGLLGQYKVMCDQSQKEISGAKTQFNKEILKIKRSILDQLYQDSLLHLPKTKRHTTW